MGVVSHDSNLNPILNSLGQTPVKPWCSSSVAAATLLITALPRPQPTLSDGRCLRRVGLHTAVTEKVPSYKCWVVRVCRTVTLARFQSRLFFSTNCVRKEMLFFNLLDNGSCFVSSEFEAFLKVNGI